MKEGEEEEETATGGRSRVLSERGLDYHLEIKERERGRLIRKLNTKTRELAETLEVEHDENLVKNGYSNWMNEYENLLEAHSEFQKLLEPSAAQQDKILFDKKGENFQKMKREVENWFFSHKQQQQDDAGSFISRASSHVSIERVKEEKRRAELMARQATLKEKQQLKEEQFRLNLKEEELDLKTELRISDAKSKVLEDLERSIIQDTGLMLPMSGTRMMNKSNDRLDLNNYMNHNNTQSERNSLFLENDNTEDQIIEDVPNSSYLNNANILTVSRELNKPRAEILKFSGSALTYTNFKRQFNSRICKNTESYDEKLNYLMQFTTGEAYRIVSGYANLPAEVGYNAAFEEFEERYGDADLIAQTYVKKVLEWPPIKADDSKGLDEFAIFLRECQYAVEHVDAARVLEYSENLRSVIQKLPFHLHDRWRNIVYDSRSKGVTIKFRTLVNFVRKEAKKAIDPVYGKERLSSIKQTISQTSRNNKFSKTMTTVVTDNKGKDAQRPMTTKSCAFCKGQHYLSDCKNITLNSLTDRYAFLRTNGLCFGCLRSGHPKRDCRKRTQCAKCQRLHPTILHVDPFEAKNSEFAVTTEHRTCAAYTGAGTALPVVPVRLKTKSSDKFIETYAFLDSGSTATFCSERVLNLLGVEGKRTTINVVTLSDKTSQVTHEIRGLEISSLNGENTIELPLVLTQPTLPISKTDVPSEEDIMSWPHLRNIEIERIDSEVDLLIGVNVPKAMEPWDIIPSEGSGPFAIKTIFGWVVNGPLEPERYGSCQTVKSNYIRTALDDQLREHFNRDFSELAINDKLEHSREDKQFMESVTQSITKHNGHYIVELPFKSEKVNMPNNRNQAKQRLSLLSKRFDKDAKFREAYKEFMTKVIDKGYAQRVSVNDIPENGKVWYLPHHGVFHPKKKKIRVVFDCAARYGGTSLNEQLLQGPNLTSSLVGTLTRFRQETVAIMGDIESMFYQVQVSPKDMNFQRFLWWDNCDTRTEPVEYQMKVHLFGATSSPSCASFALRQTTDDLKGHFNDQVVNTVLRNFYVDDCLKSVETERSATSLINDLQAVLKGGGFRITKWVSNSRKVMASVPESERAAEVKDLDLDVDELPVERTLGVNWSIESDAFSFTVDVKGHAHTRRGILSTISSIYDPLGFIAPMILNAKLMLQELCRLQISWDDPIPEVYEEKWCKWLDEIKSLRSFEVDRCFKPIGFGEVVRAELHHFSDSSEIGYGTVSYLRLMNSENKVHCTFVTGM